MEKQRDTTPNPKKLNKKIRNLQDHLEKILPYLLPDYELLLCSERTKLPILTRDNDMEEIHALSPSIKEKTKPAWFHLHSNLEKTFNQFEPKAKEKTKSIQEIHEPGD